MVYVIDLFFFYIVTIYPPLYLQPSKPAASCSSSSSSSNSNPKMAKIGTGYYRSMSVCLSVRKKQNKVLHHEIEAANLLPLCFCLFFLNVHRRDSSTNRGRLAKLEMRYKKKHFGCHAISKPGISIVFTGYCRGTTITQVDRYVNVRVIYVLVYTPR